jgi:chaperonin GroEL
MRRIAANAGQDGAVIVQSVRAKQKLRTTAHRLRRDERRVRQHDREAGIIDPAKVTRGALGERSLHCSMILTTEALITDIKEDEKPTPGGGGNMDF